jgi:DNA-binding transcriptional regulator WhiA
VASTFSADTKDALAREIPAQPHCRNALREGLYYYGAAPGGGRFRTQRPSIARLAWSLLDDRTNLQIHRGAEKRLRKRAVYEIARPRSRPARPGARCDRRMELRAAFLACGSLTAPTRGYHLEFVPPDDLAGKRLAQLLRAEGRSPRTARRNGRLVVYFKDVDEITQFLSSIGAYSAVLHLEDVRALKETKNRIRRLVNTDAANVDRAMSAAATQRESIELIDEAHGLRKLSRPLREIAQLRLAHPTETLTELGARCHPPVRKSTVGGRIAALLGLARKLASR